MRDMVVQQRDEGTDFRVVVGEEDSDEGRTHPLHLVADQHTTHYYKGPLVYGRELGQALLFREGYYTGSLLVRIQRKLGDQWIDHA